MRGVYRTPLTHLKNLVQTGLRLNGIDRLPHQAAHTDNVSQDTEGSRQSVIGSTELPRAVVDDHFCHAAAELTRKRWQVSVHARCQCQRLHDFSPEDL
jgi:hypothetical protein